MVSDDSGAGRAILKEAESHPMLEREEEQELAQRAGAGDRDATWRLVGSHLRVVVKVARPYFRQGLPMSDLLQQGTLGLLQAVRRFDPGRGVRLSTYAVWWVRAAIQDYARRSWTKGRGGPARQHRSGGRTEVAGAGTLSAAESPTYPVSSQSIRDTDGERGSSFWDRLASDAPTPEQRLSAISYERFARTRIAAALEALTPRERFVISQRYFKDVRPTFAAIGRELGVSKDRVRQLEAKALVRLREVLQPVAADLNEGA